MPTQQKIPNFRALGKILEQWRSAKYRSALAMFKEEGDRLSFSYSAYSEFERGTALPSVELLIELASTLGKNPSQALLLWAEVQMPTEEYRALFRRAISEKEQDVEKTDTQEPTLEDTWVFRPSDHKIITKTPWLWDLCLLLSMAFPNRVSFEKIMLPKNVTRRKLVEKLIRPWIEGGNILASEQGLGLRYPHLYLPRTEEWNQVRNANVQRTIDRVLGRITVKDMEKCGCYREIIHRPLTPEQMRKWVNELKKLENRFISEPYLTKFEPGQNETQALVLVLGPRKLDL